MVIDRRATKGAGKRQQQTAWESEITDAVCKQAYRIPVNHTLSLRSGSNVACGIIGCLPRCVWVPSIYSSAIFTLGAPVQTPACRSCSCFRLLVRISPVKHQLTIVRKSLCGNGLIEEKWISYLRWLPI